MKGPVPIATLLLLFANLAAAYFSLGNQDAILRWGFTPRLGNVGPVEHFVTSFTSLFVHFDPFHLLGNMLFLAGVGPAVEKAVGPLRFFTIYVVGGLAGVWLHGVLALAAMPMIVEEPVFGASASIAALIGYSWLRFGRAKIPLLPNWYVPVYFVVFLWLMLQIAGGVWVVRQLGSHNAYWAHLGGFLIGVVFAFAFRADVAVALERDVERAKQANALSVSAQEAVAVAGKASPQSLALAYESAKSVDDAEAANRALMRLFQVSPEYENALAVRELSARNLLSQIPSSQRLKTTYKVPPAAAQLLLDSILQEESSSDTANALLALLEMSAAGDGIDARHYAQRLSKEFSLSPQTEVAKAKWPRLFTS